MLVLSGEHLVMKKQMQILLVLEGPKMLYLMEQISQP